MMLKIVFLALVASTVLVKFSTQLVCYSCTESDNPNCGSDFKSTGVDVENCTSALATCVILVNEFENYSEFLKRKKGLN
jgi:hypothetical protein